MPPAAPLTIDPARLQALEAIEAVVGKIGNNPAARKLFLNARKAVEPDAVIPELDAAKPIEDALSQTNKKIDDFLAAQTKLEEERKAREVSDQFAAAWESSKRRVQERESYYDETIVEIEKLAKERNIVDFEAAAALWDKMHPPQALITPSGFGPFGLYQQTPAENDEAGKAIKALFDSRGEDSGALSNLIQMGLAEARGQRMAA